MNLLSLRLLSCCLAFFFSVSLCLCGSALAADPSRRFVYPGADDKLIYDRDERGDRIPDFSHCGYAGGGVPIPDAPVRVAVTPGRGDNGPRIQAAIDYVSGLPADADGLRGAVLLLAGRHEVAGGLRLAASGVVLRGQGQGPDGTVLVATGTDRRTLIRIAGKAYRRIVSQTPYTVADAYVPGGACRLRLATTEGLHTGDTVLVEHPSTRKWIAALGMDRFPSRDVGSWLDWLPGKMDVRWDRVITRIDGDAVTLDAPLTTSLDAAHGGSRLQVYSWPGRIRQVGVENLRCESEFDHANPLDEQHAWTAISFENTRDGWVRQATVLHFAGSAVSVWESCKGVTVEDCTSLAPVSELGGYRRRTFYTSGQLTLFQRCRAEDGRHDFAVGYLAAGPNAFVTCKAVRAHHFSGPIESWASGVLYDNITMDGGGLALTNREIDNQGAGWAAANCMLWQCTAPVVTCRRPPTAHNWAIGCWGQFVGDGHWRSLSEFVKPASLYAAQLSERLGDKAVRNIRRRDVPAASGNAKAIDEAAPDLVRKRTQPAAAPSKRLALKDGWLVCDGKLLAGGRMGTVWWRGHVLPSRAGEFGYGVTRFVPGRVGPGYTDDLDELTDTMRAKNQAILAHHWGLWYDRRRDDHQMVRRIDGAVWPPFYEQPWARSGRGTAWDGLSKYDLTRFNSWYFARLKQFADLCDRKGLLLIQEMYFQHNVLEAGAHWADFPWRPANCLQDTGFPEPPPYVNDKRIFMAEAFYDVSHPLRRELHRAYIRKCLDTLGDNSNVLFLTGEEFTGPLAFMRFWLDVIEEWQKEKGKKVLVGLSCTKDVQDAILTDPVRGPRVAVIDMKYWWYTANGGVYDPKGGESLAPRQQYRQWEGAKTRSEAQTARQVREYRLRYPSKAVLCSLGPVSGWAVLIASGSVPNLPPTTDAQLLAALPRMKPFASAKLTSQQGILAEPGRNYLLYSSSGQSITLDLSGNEGTFTVYRIDPRTGQASRSADVVHGGKAVDLPVAASGTCLLWLTRK
jgi:hypothetical protein